MSDRVAEHWLTAELAAGLSWPGVELDQCELIKHGDITGFDRASQTTEYERVDTEGGEPYYVFGILDWVGVEFHPPLAGAHPLNTGQTFWYVRDVETNKTAILRNPDQ